MINIRNEQDKLQTSMLVDAPAHAILVDVKGAGYWVFHTGRLPSDLDPADAHIVCTAAEAAAANYWQEKDESIDAVAKLLGM